MEENEKKTPFSAALSYYLDKKWGTAAALARTIDKSSGYVSTLGSGKKKGDEEVRRTIARYFGYAYDDFLDLGQWILDGKAAKDWKPRTLLGRLSGSGNPGSVDLTGINTDWMLLPGKKSAGSTLLTRDMNFSPGPPILRQIPIISWVRAGSWSEVEDQFHPGDAEDWIYTTATNHPNAFALVVKGDSMLPKFCDGDTIIVDPGREAISGDHVIAKNGDGEATFKQLIIDGRNVYLRPLNTELYKQWDMTGVRFSIIGVVVAKETRF